jgi:predicted membrane metal-binding protein
MVQISFGVSIWVQHLMLLMQHLPNQDLPIFGGMSLCLSVIVIAILSVYDAAACLLGIFCSVLLILYCLGQAKQIKMDKSIQH